jgi:hypothetical protein
VATIERDIKILKDCIISDKSGVLKVHFFVIGKGESAVEVVELGGGLVEVNIRGDMSDGWLRLKPREVKALKWVLKGWEE